MRRIRRPARCYGSVGYAYQMGEYDMTVGQYCQFLNAVAKTDTYGLYNSYMGSDYSTIRHYPERQFAQLQLLGHGQRHPKPPTVRSSMSRGAMRPGSATGCKTTSPPGWRGSGTTETGAYTLNGDHNAELTRDDPQRRGHLFHSVGE